MKKPQSRFKELTKWLQISASGNNFPQISLKAFNLACSQQCSVLLVPVTGQP